MLWSRITHQVAAWAINFSARWLPRCVQPNVLPNGAILFQVRLHDLELECLETTTPILFSVNSSKPIHPSFYPINATTSECTLRPRWCGLVHVSMFMYMKESVFIFGKLELEVLVKILRRCRHMNSGIINF